MRSSPPRSRRGDSFGSSRGLSLVELMVGMAIALIASLAIFQVFSVSESYKRTTTAGSDALQSGGFSAYLLQRTIAAAGAGFASIPDEDFTKQIAALGCPLNLYRGNTQILGQTTSPYAAAAFPAPFNTINFRLRLVPALIVAGANDNTSDVLIVMGGHHSAAGRPFLSSASTATSVTAENGSVVGINNLSTATQRQYDLLLAIDRDPGTARGNNTTCDFAQASGDPNTASPFTVSSPIALGASFTGDNGFKTASSYYSSTLAVANLGPIPAPPVPGRGPPFIALGVGSDGGIPNTLLSLNLITGYCPTASSTNGCPSVGWVAQGLANNVVAIKAIYGVAADADNLHISTWEKPSGATWGAAALAQNNNNLARLRAVRIAVIARNAQPEKQADDDTAATPRFSPATFTLFGDTSASITFGNPDRHYRYQVFDITVPLRNMLFMAQLK